MIDKQDALRWLDMQRDAVNTEIAYAAPADQKQYHENLKIINWLAERTQEMTAVDYLNARSELCKAYSCRSCDECPLSGVDGGCTEDENDPSRAVEIVKRWKEERL